MQNNYRTMFHDTVPFLYSEPGLAACWPDATYTWRDSLHARPLEATTTHCPSPQTVHSCVSIHCGQFFTRIVSFQGVGSKYMEVSSSGV